MPDRDVVKTSIKVFLVIVGVGIGYFYLGLAQAEGCLLCFGDERLSGSWQEKLLNVTLIVILLTFISLTIFRR